MKTTLRTAIASAAILVTAMLAAVPAYAHVGVDVGFSFQSGLLHPFHGLDHLLAMFAVGLLAAQLGGRALWLVPAAFVAMMLVGAFAGFAGDPAPAVEFLIVASIVAIALPVAFAFGMPAWLAMAYVGFFALFHGYAHGAELPHGVDALPYMAGFAISTAVIHAAGIAAGLACGRIDLLRPHLALRFAGSAIVLAGLVLPLV